MSEQYSHDVFISFSFKDQAIVDRIVNQLTNKYRIPCWICTKKIRAGSYYYDEIENAISSSKVFLFVQTKNSVESKEIPDEVLTAIDEGKTIISFIVEESDLHGQMKLKLKHRQHIDATIPEFDDRIRDLAMELYALLGRTLDDEYCHVADETVKEKLVSTPSVIPKSVFCGREDVIKDIAQKFDDGERVVFVQGIGGIGKTEIVKQYAKRYRSSYDTIIFATYADSLLSLVNSETPFEIEPQFSRLIQADGVQEDEQSFFERKLKKIQKLSNERTLIIIDNFDVEHDDALPELMKGKYRLLITTRCDYSRVYPCVKVGPIDSIDSLVSVFIENYQGFDVDEDDPDLVELIELVNRHTYTIELLAQHMENSGQTAREMIEALHSEGIFSLNEEVQHAGNKTQVAYKNLLKMFKVFDLSDTEKSVLRYLSLMPLSGVSVRDFKAWASLSSPKILRDLEGRSWITRNVDGIALHPIIRDVIRNEISLNKENIVMFLNHFLQSIDENNSWHFTKIEKEKYCAIGRELLSQFNEINFYTIELYISIATLFGFDDRLDEAQEIFFAIHKYYAESRNTNTLDIAYICYRIAWVFYRKDDCEQACIWYEKAKKIYETAMPCLPPDKLASYILTLRGLSVIYLNMYRTSNERKSYIIARDLSAKEISVCEALLRPDMAEYSKLAGAYLQYAKVIMVDNDHNNALLWAKKGFDILLSLFGENDADVIFSKMTIAEILYENGQIDDANKLIDSVLKGYEQYYCLSNLNGFKAMVIKIKCLVKLGDLEEAIKTQSEAINIAENIFSANSIQLKFVREII